LRPLSAASPTLASTKTGWAICSLYQGGVRSARAARQMKQKRCFGET
jgi:hypothetical protein